MQDKIDCNKINEIREERMQTQFYTGSVKFVPTFSTQATHLRFFTPFVKIRLQSLNHIGTTHPLCSRILDPHSLTIEVHGETLNGFASVCPKVSFERAFGNEVLLEYLSLTFCVPSHLFIGL